MVSSTPRQHFTPGKDPVPILQEDGWAPGPVQTGGKSRPHRDSIPDRPARSQSLYRLSYSAHRIIRYPPECTRGLGGCLTGLSDKPTKHSWKIVLLTTDFTLWILDLATRVQALKMSHYQHKRHWLNTFQRLRSLNTCSFYNRFCSNTIFPARVGRMLKLRRSEHGRQQRAG